MNKYPVKLTLSEIQDCVDFQKKSLEALAEHTHKYGREKTFEIFSCGIGLILSNFMGSFGINEVDTYLDDIMKNVKNMHESIQKNASYMEYENGKKKSEGNFN